MSDDCVYLASLGPEPGKTYSGRENLRQGFTEMTTTETELETREGRIWVSGDHAFAEWSYDETGDDGLVVEIRGLDVIHIVEGKIKSIDAYRKTT
jgi:ketosteroid isomerase-like protein